MRVRSLPDNYGATNLQQNFALEKTFLQIVRIGGVLFIQKGRKREIRHKMAL
jgi:hypothetical protein